MNNKDKGKWKKERGKTLLQIAECKLHIENKNNGWQQMTKIEFRIKDY
jgi:hypothetical protein